MEKCNCELCRLTVEFKVFMSKLPEADRASFADWYNKIFAKLEYQASKQDV